MISVIIPVRNGEQFIGNALECVLKQVSVAEVIVVEDHSTDRTADVVKSYAESHPSVKLLRALSCGVTDARILGATQATSDFIFFMDADDLIPEGTIVKMADIISRNPNVDLVIGDIIDIDGELQTEREYGSREECTGIELFNWIIDRRTGYLWGKAIRRELFLTLPFVPSELKFCEDYVQMLQLSILSRSIRHINTPSYIYVQRPQSACNVVKTREKYASQFYKFAEALDTLSRLDLFNVVVNKTSGLMAAMRLRVMMLYYARLYLAVVGGWKEGRETLRLSFKNALSDKSLMADPLFDVKLRRQTKIVSNLSKLISPIYVTLLKHKYHAIQ